MYIHGICSNQNLLWSSVHLHTFIDDEVSNKGTQPSKTHLPSQSKCHTLCYNCILSLAVCMAVLGTWWGINHQFQELRQIFQNGVSPYLYIKPQLWLLYQHYSEWHERLRYYTCSAIYVLSQCIQQQKVRSAVIITFSQLVCGPQFIFSVASTRGFPVTPDYASDIQTSYEDNYHLAYCIVICTSMTC